MRQIFIAEIVKTILTKLSSDEFKQVMDALLDQLEGLNNKNQKTWHLIIRALLSIPDND
jgi:hypothetical protein